MTTPARTARLSGIYETLGQLINNPKSLGLPEKLPQPVLAVLISTRELLREDMNGRMWITAGENDLAAELSQDADRRYGIPEEEQGEMSFPQLLCRRMEQRHLSNYDVAVSLGCTIQYVCDLITGAKAPTELHIAELALLLGVTQQSLMTAVKPNMDHLAATV